MHLDLDALEASFDLIAPGGDELRAYDAIAGTMLERAPGVEPDVAG